MFSDRTSAQCGPCNLLAFASGLLCVLVFSLGMISIATKLNYHDDVYVDYLD